jgi:hypothetical protein
MTEDAGNLSLDFLAGFTIFMVALIYVATLIPGLLIGLESKSIDYDAVAYRTGVILAEDPGMPYNPAWETYSDTDKDKVLRFGLALSKNTPNVISAEKIDRFFNTTTFVYPDDYRSQAVFGDYPYQFNISLKIDGGENYTLGDPLPDGAYGYSRRLVKIKEESSATIDGAQVPTTYRDYWSHEPNAGNLTAGDPGPKTHPVSVYFNYTDLTTNGPAYNNPAYQIDPIAPLYEGVTINLTNLNQTTLYGSGNTMIGDPNINITLTNVTIMQSVLSPYLHTRSSFATVPVTLDDHLYNVYIDGNTTPLNSSASHSVINNVSLVIPHGSITSGLNFLGGNDPSTYLNVTLLFTLDHGDCFLNSSQATAKDESGAFEYNYTSPFITRPSLKDGVLEVAVW